MGDLVLVTGGAGFVGSHVSASLADSGYEVLIVDAFRQSPTQLFLSTVKRESVAFEQCDLSDVKVFDRVLRNKALHFVVHCASNSDTRLLSGDTPSDLLDGVVATWQLCHALEKINIRPHLVFLSSQHVYGPHGTKLESSELQPMSQYGANKASAEMILRAFASMNQWRVRALRSTNIVGGGQRFGVLVDYLVQLRSDSPELRILGNGRQRRSFLHVSDVCTAVGALLQHAAAVDRPFEAFNASTSDSITVREVMEIARAAIDAQPRKIVASSSVEQGWSGDLGSIVMPSEKLRSFGWEPELTSARAIWKAAIEIDDQGIPRC